MCILQLVKQHTLASSRLVKSLYSPALLFPPTSKVISRTP